VVTLTPVTPPLAVNVAFAPVLSLTLTEGVVYPPPLPVTVTEPIPLKGS
jgi:hypothetical protein